jgi:bidirectional [NiFe] hydrogenase diaphorase subunit
MNPEELEAIAEKEKRLTQSLKHRIHICGAAGCLSQHSEAVKEAFDKEIKRRGLDQQCRIKRVGCLGLCAIGPLVAVEGEDILYHNVTVEDVPRIVEALDHKPVTELSVPLEEPFFSHQNKIVLDTCGKVDPERIEDYIALGGYRGLRKAVCEMRPSEVIDQVTRSGLRGRGGAGFPTGLKWGAVAKASNTRKFVVCNADEGDPGAFMDRTILASDPHKVIEGIIVGAHAVGASEGYIYVRAEYPLAINRLRTAIHQAERLGLLGKNIFGTSFSFSVELRLGAGAFVCGEETALIASIEGKRGTPRPRPPFPAEAGLWGLPTLINNVETFAHIPRIILEGGDWYAKLGTEKSKGTKMFALAGRVKNTGLIEVPMGTTLREIIFKIGGFQEGHRFKAVQTGGPSGGCIPEQFLDTPVDYESLARLGSIMGSGGMVVMDETSCMVDVAKYFIDFCTTESCGKCVPCRVGTAQMHDILCKITKGAGTMQDLTVLEELCDLVKNASLCGLGQTAANPILSTLRYFRDEYLAHIENRTCPAGVCKIEAGGS